MTDEHILKGPIQPQAKPEMSRPFAIARIGDAIRVLVESKPEERVALALRMGLPAIYSLTCRFDLRRDDGDIIEASALLLARISQVCVVSLDPFDADLVEPFSVRFIPASAEQGPLDPDSEDEISYEGGLLDLGEATSEQLALALDPFPRKPGAELPQSAVEPDASAFSALAKLLPRA